MKTRKQNRRSNMELKKWVVYLMVGSGVTSLLVILLFPVTIKVSYEKNAWTFRVFTSKSAVTEKSHQRISTVKSMLLSITMSNLSGSGSSKHFTSGNIRNNQNSPTESVPVTNGMTSGYVIAQQITPRANMTRNTSNQVITTSHWQGDVMPAQPPPSDIIPPKSANHSICTILMGGLGNQMFQFATTFGLAAQKGMSIAVDKTDYLTKIFKMDIDQRENYRNICKTFIGRGEQLNCGYDDKMASFPTNNNYRVGYYLQSWMYFYNASVSLRKQFVFHESITETKNRLIDSVLNKHHFTSRSNVTLIGVHIRRGNLVNHTYGYMVASSSYLQKSVNYFQSKELKHVIYIICSNDMKWSKEYMPKGVRSEYIEGNSPEVDMAILGSCDHMISTVGTFSWWSAWLTGGEVTFYQWPAKEGSGLRKQFSKDYKDFFHPGWIGFS